jgi:hypothetical protein
MCRTLYTGIKHEDTPIPLPTSPIDLDRGESLVPSVHSFTPLPATPFIELSPQDPLSPWATLISEYHREGTFDSASEHSSSPGPIQSDAVSSVSGSDSTEDGHTPEPDCIDDSSELEVEEMLFKCLPTESPEHGDQFTHISYKVYRRSKWPTHLPSK